MSVARIRKSQSECKTGCAGLVFTTGVPRMSADLADTQNKAAGIAVRTGGSTMDERLAEALEGGE